MTQPPEGFDCRNCGHRVTSEAPDHHGWCKACRAKLVRRSTVWAVFPALLAVGLFGWLLQTFGLFDSTFVIVWFAMGVALGWIVFKICRRVFFDIIRNRGVKPPTS